jgi:hypothetical protein
MGPIHFFSAMQFYHCRAEAKGSIFKIEEQKAVRGIIDTTNGFIFNWFILKLSFDNHFPVLIPSNKPSRAVGN